MSMFHDHLLQGSPMLLRKTQRQTQMLLHVDFVPKRELVFVANAALAAAIRTNLKGQHQVHQ